MKTALLTAVAFSALAATQVLAQASAPAQPGAQAPAAEGAGGCPCCQKMAMMKKSDHGTMQGHGAPSGSETPRQ
jgi:hypothetical protein